MPSCRVILKRDVARVCRKVPYIFTTRLATTFIRYDRDRLFETAGNECTKCRYRLPENQQQMVSLAYPHIPSVCVSIRQYRQGLQWYRPSFQNTATLSVCLHGRGNPKIENSVDQSSPHGKRDYAALLLATRLGIRSGDISSMTLECLDFERNLIRLTQHKTGVFIEFPMVSDVKVALERYLQEERTAYDSPYVFLRIVPPYGHISVQAIAKIARTAIAVAGIEPGGRKQGAHAFRSSLASSMINDNIPYEAVRKSLDIQTRMPSVLMPD